MAEYTIAKMICDFERTLEEYTKGNTDIDMLFREFRRLKAGIPSVVSRYCDDFSSPEYHTILREMEKKEDVSD